jgi:hypothetical protein
MTKGQKKIKQLNILPDDGILLCDIQTIYSGYKGDVTATGEDVQGFNHNINLDIINKINKANNGVNLNPLGYLKYNYSDDNFSTTKKLVYSITEIDKILESVIDFYESLEGDSIYINRDITLKKFGIKYHIFKKIFKYYNVSFP